MVHIFNGVIPFDMLLLWEFNFLYGYFFVMLFCRNKLLGLVRTGFSPHDLVYNNLWNHPFLLALYCQGHFARRNVCDSAAKIPYWCRNHNPSSHGVPNTNLSNFTCLLVDFGKVLCSSANELQQNSNASSREDYIPQIMTILLVRHSSHLHLTFVAFCLLSVIRKQ